MNFNSIKKSAAALLGNAAVFLGCAAISFGFPAVSDDQQAVPAQQAATATASGLLICNYYGKIWYTFGRPCYGFIVGGAYGTEIANITYWKIGKCLNDVLLIH